MYPYRPFACILMFVSVVFAGCLGGGEEAVPTPAPQGAEEAAPTAETGSITGTIVTKDLEEVKDATVTVLDAAGAAVGDRKTDANGRYTFNDLAPGEYTVQVFALCCRAAVEVTSVVAGEVAYVDLQLDRLTNEDLQLPYMAEDQWTGFISCGLGAGVPGVRNPKVAVCAVPGVVDDSLADPNEDFLHEFNLSAGLKTLYVAMDWEPVGGVSGGNLNLLVEQRRCEEVACTDAYKYADLDGAPPLVARIDVEDIERPDALFDNMTEEGYKYRIFAGDGYANLIYQQPFTVYWYAFYWEHAPEDFNPLPDA